MKIKGKLGIEIDKNYGILGWYLLKEDNKPYPTFHTDINGRICLGTLAGQINNEEIQKDIQQGNWEKLTNTIQIIRNMLMKVDLIQAYGIITTDLESPEVKSYLKLREYLKEISMGE